MCLVLLPTSLVQHPHSHIYSMSMDSEILELHCHLYTVFCTGPVLPLCYEEKPQNLP